MPLYTFFANKVADLWIIKQMDGLNEVNWQIIKPESSLSSKRILQIDQKCLEAAVWHCH